MSSLFLRAANREPVERTPIWLMRQAGRILPEYRLVRERWSLVEICREPELAAGVTMQPMRRMPLDAAVMFSDIMIPLIGIGVGIEIVEGVGPVIERPFRDPAAVRALRGLEPAVDVPYVAEAIRLVRQELEPDRAVLGFAGAPFTLASYLIEGKPSRTFARTKAMMLGEPPLWHALMARLTDIVIEHLRAQIDAGVDAVQLFDSWVGALSPSDYEQAVQPYTRRIFAALRPTGVPLIHFGVGTAGLLDLMKGDGGTVLGVDWRIELDDAWNRIGISLGLQGNLDPAALLAPTPAMERKALDVLHRVGRRRGHIFNLGHGLLPETPVDNVMRLVDFVHEESARIRGEAGLAPAARDA
jgi:uroporphyrinogen decarboxylase